MLRAILKAFLWDKAMSLRMMIGWRSNGTSLNGNGALPFSSWISNRRISESGEEVWICAVLEAENQFSAEAAIRQYYPDAKVSFCEVPPEWWVPNEK